MSDKRQDYISWDEYFMGVAMLSAMRSKDPHTQVGACIVSDDHKILSMGYNGFPMGCSDDDFPWCREGEPYDNKYFYTTHSELNAILNYRGGSLEGATLYVSLFPCNECAKAIIQSGIRRIVYDQDKYEHTPAVMASKRMLRAAGVEFYKYEHTGREITISLYFLGEDLKKKESNEVANALVLIVQIGVTMLVPILLCAIGGAWLDHKLGTRWISVLGFVLGAIAGFQNVYRLVKKYLKDTKSPGQLQREKEEQEKASYDQSIKETE